VSNYKLELPNRRVQRASWLKSRLEKSNFAKASLLFASMLGTAMVIGDGVLTPCISGLHIYFPFTHSCLTACNVRAIIYACCAYNYRCSSIIYIYIYIYTYMLVFAFIFSHYLFDF